MLDLIVSNSFWWWWQTLLFVGVGAMTWSPLACGIISGKYDGRVPPYSRASLKVDPAPCHWSATAPFIFVTLTPLCSPSPTGCSLFVLLCFCLFQVRYLCILCSCVCVVSAVLTSSTSSMLFICHRALAQHILMHRLYNIHMHVCVHNEK